MPKAKKVSCGLVMPISAIDGCSAEHWIEVKNIITESLDSIEEYQWTVNLVSDADEIGVIQKRIVQNLYSSDLVVCDVSCKNPNVMFELGMRLAFDKPTIIIKDDKTNYSFDTGIIEHLTYPRDLRFGKIVAFKEKLSEKATATYGKSLTDPEHSTFLKNFGKFHVANLSEDVVSSDKIVIEMLSDMQQELSVLRRRVRPSVTNNKGNVSLVNNIRRGIRMWSNKNNCEISPMLLTNDDFVDYLSERVNAADRYNSKNEFIGVVEGLIGRMAA